MVKQTSLPDEGQVSVLLATSLLTNTLTRYVHLPPVPLNVELPGFALNTQITFDILVSILAAGLIAAGMHWLIHSHPFLGSQSAWPHIWLPSLSAFVISVLIHEVPSSRLIWWVVLALGAFFLMVVIVAEYVSIDQQNTYYSLAVIGLTGVSFSIYAVLILLWHTNGMRLILLAGFLLPLTMLISMRVLSLRLSSQSFLWEACAVATIEIHIVAALHYWPLSSPRFAVMSAGALYVLNSLVVNVQLEPSRLRQYLEPACLLVLLWGAAIWLS